MAYDEGLAERIRDVLPKGAVEKLMFGGIGWTERGHLIAGVKGDDLIARCHVDDTAALLKMPGAKPFGKGGKDGGKGMRGWILVDPTAIDDDADLKAWVERSRAFAKTQPAK